MKRYYKIVATALILITIIELLRIINIQNIKVAAVENSSIVETQELKPSFSYINDDINNSLVIS